MFYKYKNKSMNQRILIAGDASAEAVTTLVFMALHDEFQFGKTRLERIVRIWDELPQSSTYELNIRCEILKEFEKEYGRIDIGPKWGLNVITGKPRKKNEVIL